MSGKKTQAKRGSKADNRYREILRLGAELLFPSQQTGNHAPALLSQRDLIVDAVSRLLEARATLWLAEELFMLTTLESGPHLPAATVPPAPLMRCAFDARLPCFSKTLPPEPAHCETLEECAAGQALAVAIPLLVEDPETHLPAVLGVLQVERPDGPPFTAADLDAFQGLAVQTSLALHSARLMAVERWRLQQLDLVRQVSSQIATVRDLDELTRQVTQLILSTFHYYYVVIFTLEPGAGYLIPRNSAGPVLRAAEDDQPVTLAPIQLGEGLVGWAAEHGREIIANNVAEEPRYRYSDALPETRAEVALPLVVEGQVLGVLDVQSNLPNDFHETDLIVLRALAGNIAGAVEGTRLVTALRRRAEQIQAIYDISNTISSELDPDKLLEQVAELVHRHFGFPYVHLFSVHSGRRKLFYEAGSGPRSQQFERQGYTIDLDDPRGIIPWVARHGETVVANDVIADPRYKPSALPPEVTRSELAVPMIFGSTILGVMDVQSDQENAFGEDDRFLFEALADTIAVAMRNASLYRSESWRRQVAESMREVSGLLSADADLDQVLDVILEELDKALPCDVAAIWLLDEAYQGETENEMAPRLRLAAVTGADLSSLGLEVGLSLEELLFVFSEPSSGALDVDTSWLIEGLHAGEPVVRSSESSFEPLGFALDFPSDYSAIAAPLRVGDQPLGILVLAHHAPGRYGTEARSMTATFASYAAVAIENTRLYEAAHEQAWVSTVLLQVGEATQSLTNLNELLATVVRITPMLVGVQACALYMLDEEGVFIPAAAYGFDRDQQAQFERWRFAPGEVPALDRLAEEKQPLVLRGSDGDLTLLAILNAGAQESGTAKAELLVLIPLLARGELIGAMLVDYAGEQNNRAGAMEELFDERLAILQGIAHQTATAVENIRLLKSQREEAYVSVALLQVAQAVVSSADLQETLGAIVRITPILAGVKRSLIFLWDAEYSAFRLAQAYGIPRQAEGEIYTPQEFPLLEAVRKWDTLMAYPLDQPDDDVPESWTPLPVPDLDEVDDFLESDDSLLLAFPLSVKGDVLGVLLVEEPDPLTIDTFSGGSLSRLREKRLEITRGISQQAALAIQNDLLQREMVERERLEREFQLARGIQRTFLPHTIPDLPGWDMSVRWRTAREVGGDFYDYFELPGGQYGFVVADVADKGMPAALFMVLVRTLVRAAVSNELSPAKVLEQVNEILLPDAQQGMFVTIFYTVLDMASGELRFANAGHNPPLLIHHGGEPVETLARGGMALGVMEGIHIEEQQARMAPGDYLVLYTDGLTEAFGEDGSMFGIEGLQQTLEDALSSVGETEEIGEVASPTVATLSAQELLDRIEERLAAFTGDQVRADDLTLLAVRRLLGDTD